MRKLIERLDVALFVVKVWIVNASRIARFWLNEERWSTCESCGYCHRVDGFRWVQMRGGSWQNWCRECRTVTELCRTVITRRVVGQ